MRVVSAVLVALVALLACSADESAEPPAVPCAAAEISSALELVPAVRVVADEGLDPIVRADLASYLGRLWGRAVTVETGTPDTVPGDVVWVSSSEAARARAGAPPNGYALVREDAGGRRIVVVAAPREHIAAAAYALLEELGVRFFHPMQELVPALGGSYLPRALAARRSPMTKLRGLQVHLLHPLEYLESLQVPGEKNLAEAKRLVDWLVKTGQNHLQWPLLASVAWEPFAAHARAIVEYAHARGVTVGCMVLLFEKSSLQRGLTLVKDAATFEADIAGGTARILQVPWDDVDLALGEFLAEDPERLLTWLDTAVANVKALSETTDVAVHNHVGNYPQLYSDFRGKRTFFYHVPEYADPRLGQNVHTLFWFDTYRDGGMYGHPDFRFQREYMLAMLAAGRRVRYFPESAYWIASDVDVPAFLPEYVESRWTDIHRLDEDLRAAALPPLDGHLLFSSGHEWGYWMTDYLTAKMLWEPAAPLDRFFAHVTSAYGSCAPDVQASLTSFVALQRSVLFEKKLVTYVSGEDNAVALAAAANQAIRDVPVSFDALVTGDEGIRGAFETNVLAPLAGFARDVEPLEAAMDARCRGSDATLAPWCNELRDGMRIVRLRVLHTVGLYRSVLAYARGDADAARAELDGALRISEDAKRTIEAREREYRFPVERLTGAYENATSYPYGYLRQAHTQCFFRRREEQARRIVEEGLVGSTSGLPSCLD